VDVTADSSGTPSEVIIVEQAKKVLYAIVSFLLTFVMRNEECRKTALWLVGNVIAFLQEAQVMQRVAELRKQGLWSAKRLPKVQEPGRLKAHWDYLTEEMQWLAADFAQERKWKKAGCRKVCFLHDLFLYDRLALIIIVYSV
jgi:hypothetical protein